MTVQKFQPLDQRDDLLLCLIELKPVRPKSDIDSAQSRARNAVKPFVFIKQSLEFLILLNASLLHREPRADHHLSGTTLNRSYSRRLGTIFGGDGKVTVSGLKPKTSGGLAAASLDITHRRGRGLFGLRIQMLNKSIRRIPSDSPAIPLLLMRRRLALGEP